MRNQNPYAPKAKSVRATILYCLAAFAIGLVVAGCQTVRFNERQRLGEAAMQFDPNPLASEMTGKVLTSREGSVGGFFGSSVGGCGCN
ncbi:MAG: hypothetical protein ACI9OJ_005971 [Myxococcota bacterium]|jgi:hypothetical protein